MQTELDDLDLTLRQARWLSREDSDLTQVVCSSSAGPTILIKNKKNKGRYRLVQPRGQLENNLLPSVGFLQLANALDFAANIWNQTPIPTFAMALMAVGGSVAILMSLEALRDARRSWKNVRLLRDERKYIHQLKRLHTPLNKELARTLDSRLGVNLREAGSEFIDRVLMDAILGFGGILVGVGTLMAIGGANHAVFLASNLLSGYIGNSLVAMFGLLNAFWSGYLWIRFRRHAAAVAAAANAANANAKTASIAPFQKLLQLRCDRIRLHALLAGITGLAEGAASIISATKWWGYVLLIPCILSSIFVNFHWRTKIGYHRPILDNIRSTKLSASAEDLTYVVKVHQAFVLHQSPPDAIMDPNSVSSIIQFIIDNDLFSNFCEWLLQDPNQAAKIINTDLEQVIVTTDNLAKAGDQDPTEFCAKANEFLQTFGSRHFKDRERYLLELFAYDLWRNNAVPMKQG